MLIKISTITGCISISAVASVVGISIEILSSETGVNICVVTAGIKKYKSTNKKRKKHVEIVLLAKSKLNSIEVLIIDSNTSHDNFVLINNVLKEFYDMEEEIKNSNDI